MPSKAPTDIATMASAISTSSSVKPRCRLRVFHRRCAVRTGGSRSARLRPAAAGGCWSARRCRCARVSPPPSRCSVTSNEDRSPLAKIMTCGLKSSMRASSGVEHDGPAFDHDLRLDAFGKFALAQRVVFVGRAPLVLQHVEHHEGVAAIVDAKAVVAGLQLGLLAHVVEQRVEPLGFLVELGVAPVAAEGDDGRGGDQADDEHHDHELDQREARATGRARRARDYCPRFQLPMSAFAPSPPSWLSAPKE